MKFRAVGDLGSNSMMAPHLFGDCHEMVESFRIKIIKPCFIDRGAIQYESIFIWVGGLEDFLFFHIYIYIVYIYILGISSSQLTNNSAFTCCKAVEIQ